MKYNKYKTKILNKIRPYFSRISFSCLFAVGILLLSYFASNFVYPLDGSLSPIMWTEILLNRKKPNLPDDLLLVNVSFDKELRNYYQPLVMTKDDGKDTISYICQGKIAVTDRSKLFTFLSEAKRANNYKYIFLDIRFQDRVEADTISTSLYELISSMDRIVVAKHSSIEQSSPILANKSAYSDAPISKMESNITRLPLLYNNESTLPMYAMEDYTNCKLRYFGPFYFMDGHLCSRTIFPTFSVYFNDIDDAFSSPDKYQFVNLGQIVSYQINCPEDFPISSETDNKYVLIGDFINDTHDTYLGEQLAGPLILFNMFMNLMDHKHYVSFWGTVFLFVLYSLIALFIIEDKHILDFPYLKSLNTSKIGFFISSFVSLSIIFVVLTILSYVVFGLIYDVFIPSVSFSILSLWIRFKKY